MEKAVLEEKKLAEARPFYWLDIVQVPRSARAFIVANTLAGIVQLDGINSVVYYIGVLFKELGFSAEKSVYMSLVGGGSLMLGTIPAILLLDKWGRRMVGIVPSIVVFFGCIIIGCSFLSKNTKTYEGIYIWGLITYELFSGSFQSLPWLTFAEVYPTYLRSFGMTIADAFIYLWAFTVTYNFTGMRNAMTNTGLFVGFYGGISLFGVIFIILFLPELKGKTLEEVDDIFSQPMKEIARQNLHSSINTMKKLFSGRWKEIIDTSS
ncbi:Inositol transporter 1 [Galdieria sulphuraria]|nr:Inositol transporter 1 [Galdieria sulphuraria]